MHNDFDSSWSLGVFSSTPTFGNLNLVSVVGTYMDGKGAITFNVFLEYILGIIFLAALSVGLFMLWIALLITFKCLFPHRKSFLARKCCISAREHGCRLQECCSSSCCLYKNGAFLAGNGLHHDSKRKSAVFRIFMYVTSAIFISMGILIFIQGGKEQQQTYNYIDDGTRLFHKIRDNLHASINSTIYITNEIKGPFLSEFRVYSNDTCTDIQDVSNTFIESLSFFEVVDFTHILQFESVFDKTLFPVVDTVEKGANSFQNYAKIFYFAWPMYFLGLLLAFGTTLAVTSDPKTPDPDSLDVPPIRDPGQESQNRYFCFHRWVILPIYFSLITIFLIVSASSGTVLISNAEFCLGYGSPTGFVEAVANSSEIEGIKREILDYYVINECMEESLFQPLLSSFVSTVSDTHALIDNELNSVDEILENDQSSCGGYSTWKPLLTTMDQLGVILWDLDNALQVLYDSVSCHDLNLVYSYFVNDALCSSIPNSVHLVFACYFTSFLLGMIIFILRGALLPLSLSNTDGDEDSTGFKSDDMDDNPDYSDGESDPKPIVYNPEYRNYTDLLTLDEKDLYF